MKLSEPSLFAKHSKMEQKPKKKEKEVHILVKTYMSCVEHLATSCCGLDVLRSLRSSWVNLLQE